MKRYSEAFKLQVVSEYEGGQSVRALRHKYGITGNGTIESWVKKYGHVGLRHELVPNVIRDLLKSEPLLQAREAQSFAFCFRLKPLANRGAECLGNFLFA